MAEQPEAPHSHILELLRRFGLHPFTRILKPKLPVDAETPADAIALQPAGEALLPATDEEGKAR